MKSLFGGSAIIASVLSAFVLFSAKPSEAETLVSQFKQPNPQQAQPKTQDPSGRPSLDNPVNISESGTLTGKVIEPANSTQLPVSLPISFVATAYSLRGKTASGRYVSQGIIAADPRVLPLGSRVRLEAGAWSGEYLVADTGGVIRGRKIDIWTPTTREALRFGRRTVKLTVLSYGGRRSSMKRKVQI